MNNLFFSGWETLARTAIIALLAYPLMLVMVRVSGHRTLSRLNAFDLIVTVALGSTLASVITSRDIALAQGLLAFLILIFLQYTIAKSAAHWTRAESFINGEPKLLMHNGQFLHDAMRRERISEEEIKSAIRAAGHADISCVRAVVLETNGALSVVWREVASTAGAIKYLETQQN